MDDLAEAAERQNEIIKIQSDVINELFLLLLQHISAEEADKLPVISQIDTAARLRKGLVMNGRVGMEKYFN